MFVKRFEKLKRAVTTLESHQFSNTRRTAVTKLQKKHQERLPPCVVAYCTVTRIKA